VCCVLFCVVCAGEDVLCVACCFMSYVQVRVCCVMHVVLCRMCR
jgi:hypothetical protein